LNALRTICEDGDAVVILDQTRLPAQTAFVRLTNLDQAAHAIRSMQVRGAPLIGATAAYGVALALREGIDLDQAVDVLAATRPTAVNLRWALERMARMLRKSVVAARLDIAWREARAIAREDEQANAAIGRHGLSLLQPVGHRPVQAMTHCNAGWLATVAHGTAIAPIYAAHDAGIDVHVWVSETRPRNQGLLTAWELAHAGIPHTLIADNAAGLLMMQGKVDLSSSVPTASRPTATLPTRSAPTSRLWRRANMACRSTLRPQCRRSTWVAPTALPFPSRNATVQKSVVTVRLSPIPPST
jgi:methylthioribose-1-phosphate isomerase